MAEIHKEYRCTVPQWREVLENRTDFLLEALEHGSGVSWQTRADDEGRLIFEPEVLAEEAGND
jgi:hypothetical protein